MYPRNDLNILKVILLHVVSLISLICSVWVISMNKLCGLFLCLKEKGKSVQSNHPFMMLSVYVSEHIHENIRFFRVFILVLVLSPLCQVIILFPNCVQVFNVCN